MHNSIGDLCLIFYQHKSIKSACPALRKISILLISYLVMTKYTCCEKIFIEAGSWQSWLLLAMCTLKWQQRHWKMS